MPQPNSENQSNMPLGRTDRAGLTAVNELLQNGINALVALLITPYIARKLGFEQYGIWLMIAQLLGYVTWADLSPGSALKLSLVTRQHEADAESKRRIISASLLVALINLPIYAIGWFLLYEFLPVLLKNSTEWVSSARLAMTIMVLGGFLSNFFNVFSNILRAMNAAFKAMGLRSFVLLGLSMAQILVVGSGLGMPGLAFLRIAGDVALSILLFDVARRSFSWLGLSRPRKQDVFGLLKFSPWLFLYSFGYTLFQSSDLLIIGWILGPTVAASYGLTRTLPLLADRWLRPVVLSTTAGMGDLYGRGEIGRLAAVRTELHMIVLFLASIFGAFALVLNRSFVDLWIGQGQFAGLATSTLLIVAIALSLCSVNDLTLLDVCGYLSQRVLWYTLCGLFVVLCGVVLGKNYGTTGVAGGIVFGQILLLFGIQVMVFRKVLNADLFFNYFKAIARPLFLVVIIYVVAFVIGSGSFFSSWMSLMIAALCTGICAAALMWLVGFTTEQRTMLQARLFSPIYAWVNRTG